LKTVVSNVKVKEIYNLMITSLEQETKNKRSNSLETDLKNILVKKNQLMEVPKRIWFKGSRYR
tara:strand:- start:867 stop:1055 length:189 start_codon:yes stop_codon:yes gene_type:complete